MIVILSTALFTVITGTGMSNFVPVFAEEDECENNGDDSCNEQTQKTILKNECKIENEIENDHRSDENVNGEIGNGDVICSIGPNGNGIVDEDPFDLTREECIECFEQLSDSQVLQLSVTLNDKFGTDIGGTRAEILDQTCEALEQGLPHPGLVPGDVGEALEEIDTVSEALPNAIVACLRGELP